jgi:hypothetical protein
MLNMFSFLCKIKYKIIIEAGLFKYVAIHAHMQSHDHRIQEKDGC